MPSPPPRRRKPKRRLIRRIVSGGQTGVDRAALDVAMALGIPHSGWCPLGRRADDGPIPARYRLVELPTPVYRERTMANVRDSDATLILTRRAPRGGTRLTRDFARDLKKPCLVVDLAGEPDLGEARRWLASLRVGTLNVAGPRERNQPGIGAQSRQFLRRLLQP